MEYFTAGPRRAFFLIAESCKKNAFNFREVYDSYADSYIKGILTGRSGEKYTICIYENMMEVEWGINIATFHDDASKAIEKLYNYMKQAIPDSDSFEREIIEELIKDFY